MNAYEEMQNFVRVVESGSISKAAEQLHDREVLARVTDLLDDVTTYAYDTLHAAPGLLTAETRPETNAPFTQVYDPAGRVSTQTDAESNAFQH